MKQQYRQLSVCVCLTVALTAVFMAAFIPDAHAQSPDREFTISVGETLTFSGRGVRSVSIGLPKVADAQQIGERNPKLIVRGKQPGTTTIRISGRSGEKTLLIRVVGTNPESLADEVREVLGKRSGVDVRVVKGRVLLEGEVSGEKFKRKIKTLTKLYPNQVLNFTTFREAFVKGAKMVAVDIYFVQLATTNRDQLGVKWGQFIGANYSFGSGDVPLYYDSATTDSGVTPGSTGSILSDAAKLTGGEDLTSYWSAVGQVNVALDFLVENGLIKTINHGTLITEAGKDATYHNGGTLLVPVEGAVGTSGQVERIPYGLDISMLPVVDANGNVRLEIDLDYSELDYSNGYQDLPALRDNAVKTVVNTTAGQSVLVSSQENLSKTSNETGWWLLSRIPILGWLFKSRNYVGTTLDNALFITPKLYEPGNKAAEDMVGGVFKKLIDAGADSEDLPDLSEPAASPKPASPEAGDGASDGTKAPPSLID